VSAIHTERFIFPDGEMVDFMIVDVPSGGPPDIAALEAAEMMPAGQGGEPRPLSAAPHKDGQYGWLEERIAAEFERLWGDSFFG
jgi:hypothetical protein